MAERNFKLEQYSENRASDLRQKIEGLNGKFLIRKIGLDYVTSTTVDLHLRPDYSPRITIFQIKELEDGNKLTFHEIIFTSNEFLAEFQKFLREKMEDVEPIENESPPVSHQEYFDLSGFSLISSDSSRLSNTVIALRMIEPGSVAERLSGIEEKGVFTAVIKEFEGGVVALEYRLGNEFNTVDHILFTAKE